jgi:hypothetical protein
MPVFQVTHLGIDDSENQWSIPADEPEVALTIAIETAGHSRGIYSVWDPEDPMGMPLGEQTID